MRYLRLGLLTVLLASAYLFAGDIPKGTKVAVRTSDMVISNRSLAGDSVDAVLVDDLVVKGKVLAPRGSAAHCVVTSADPSRGGKFPLPGSVSIRLDTVETSQGTYHLSSNQYTRQGKTRGGSRFPADTGGGISIGSAGGVQAEPRFPLPDPGNVSIATGGPEAIIPAQSVITFRVAAASSLDPKN